MNEVHARCYFSSKTKEAGASALDITKRLLDYGIHPNCLFPINSKTLMIEPTETESKETLDKFVEIMISIAEEAESSPDTIKNALIIHQ